MKLWFYRSKHRKKFSFKRPQTVAITQHSKPNNNLAMRMAAIAICLVILSTYLVSGMFGKFYTDSKGTGRAFAMKFGIQTEVNATTLEGLYYGRSSLPNDLSATVDGDTIELVPYDQTVFYKSQFEEPDKIIHLRTANTLNGSVYDGADGVFGRITNTLSFDTAKTYVFEFYYKEEDDQFPVSVDFLHPHIRSESLSNPDLFGDEVVYDTMQIEDMGRFYKCTQRVTLPQADEAKLNAVFGENSGRYSYAGLLFENEQHIDCHLWGLKVTIEGGDETNIIGDDPFTDYKFGNGWIYKYFNINDQYYQNGYYINNNESNWYDPDNVWINIVDYNKRNFPTNKNMLKVNSDSDFDILIPVDYLQAGKTYNAYLRYSETLSTEWGNIYVMDSNFNQLSDEDVTKVWNQIGSGVVRSYRVEITPTYDIVDGFIKFRVYRSTDNVDSSEFLDDTIYVYDLALYEGDDTSNNLFDEYDISRNIAIVNSPNGADATARITIDNISDVDVNYNIILTLPTGIPNVSFTLDGAEPTTTVTNTKGQVVLTFDKSGDPFEANTSRTFTLAINVADDKPFAKHVVEEIRVAVQATQIIN